MRLRFPMARFRVLYKFLRQDLADLQRPVESDTMEMALRHVEGELQNGTVAWIAEGVAHLVQSAAVAHVEIRGVEGGETMRQLWPRPAG